MNFEKLDKRIERYMNTYSSRGLCLGIIKDDKVIYQKAYGKRNEQGDEMTLDTMMPIASITKTFTGAMIEKLKSKDKISLQDKISDYLTGFAMSDETASKNVTIEDALSHRSGLARNEFAWMGAGLSRQECVQNIKYMPMLAPFRTRYHYTNLMFSAVCTMLEERFQKPWYEIMKEEITNEVGMEKICFTVSDIAKFENHATNYLIVNGQCKDLPYFNIDAVAGAGCINTTCHEMLKWLTFAVNYGEVNGKKVLDKNSFMDMIEPRINANNSVMWKIPEFKNKTYALGWQNDVFRGKTMIKHTGGINGFFTFIAAVPEENLGVVVLNNTVGRPIEDLIALQIIDELLGNDNAEYFENYIVSSDERDKIAGQQAVDSLTAKRVEGTVLSLPKEKYEGTYSRAGYPKIEFFIKGEEYLMKIGLSTSKLTYWHYDTFVSKYSEAIYVPITFNFDEDKNVKSLSIFIESNIGYPLEFTKENA